MTGAYYNEIDPFAAAWLRELIKAGLIADGEVDERSIELVRPDDLRGFVQCHFFAGIGGWSYALRLAGWPDDHAVWTGSCPCQPFSSAGAQAGGNDSRDLWPVWFQLVKECRPVVVFGEQVEAAIGHGWLDRLCDDLEAEDYAVGAVGLPGPCVGAFDIRQRLWFVAESDGRHESQERASDEQGRQQPSGRRTAQRAGIGTAGRDGGLAQSAGAERGSRRSGCSGADCRGARAKPSGSSHVSELADAVRADGERRAGSVSGTEAASGGARELDGYRSHRSEYGGEAGGLADIESRGQRIDDGSAPRQAGHVDADNPRSQGRRLSAERAGERATWSASVASELGHADGAGREARHGQPVGTEARSAKPSDSCFWRDADWLPCADGKARPVEPGTFPLAYGVPARVGRLRGYGNAIKPQVAAAFIEAFVSVDR